MDRSLVSGIAWTALYRWAAQIISWFGTFYAARILVPADFGIVAMAALGIGLARMVEGFGLDAILVQDRSIVGVAQERLAGLLVGFGALLALGFMIVSPLVALFFQEPAVRGVMVGMSFLLIFDAIQVVPRATLQRDLEFRRLAIVTFVQFVATTAVLVAAARAGWGYWALVLNSLGGAAAATVLLFWWAPYRVAWPHRIRELASPLLQGWRVLASRIAWYGYSSADQTIIGRVLGTDLLGAYSFALTFSTIAQDEIGAVVSRVVPGVFSQVQNRIHELKRYFLLLTEFLTVLSFPVSIGMALIADLMVPLVLGEEWGAVVVPLQLLCFYAAFISSQTLISHVLLWTGQFRVHMWLSILALVTMPIALLVAVRGGLPGVGAAWALVFPLVNLPAFYYGFRTIDTRPAEWLDSLKPAVAGCLVMAVAVMGVRWILPAEASLLMRTVLAVGAGATAYPLTVWVLFRARVDRMIALARTLRNAPAPSAGT